MVGQYKYLYPIRYTALNVLQCTSSRRFCKYTMIQVRFEYGKVYIHD